MIIDLIEESGYFDCRYESDISPKIGDTVTLLQATSEVKMFSTEVLTCDHLIGPTFGSLELTEKLITCKVRRL